MEQKIIELKNKCTDMRKLILKMIHHGKKGHPGGALSCVEFVACYYFDLMNYKVDNPLWEDRDRFVLSKGHASSAQYVAMALKGIIPMETLDTYGDINSILQGHPDMNKCKGIEISTGSLGQGLGASVGMALGAKLDHKHYKVYVCVGDGECNEGMVWEAIGVASKYKLDNLIVFVDKNNLQGDGNTDEIMPPLDLKNKFEAFGCDVYEVDGNDVEALLNVLYKVKDDLNNKPKCIIGHTIKGKGISFMEGNNAYHGKAPNDKEYQQAISELNNQYVTEE